MRSLFIEVQSKEIVREVTKNIRHFLKILILKILKNMKFIVIFYKN